MAREVRRPELRASLIEEEARETCDAIRAGDLVEAIDGMCDILYVVFGTAVEFGIDLAPFFAEVHRTNMLKVGGATREDGKILKPEGWEKPRILDILQAMSGGIFECESCGVGRELSNLSEEGYCETCVTAPRPGGEVVSYKIKKLKATCHRCRRGPFKVRWLWSQHHKSSQPCIPWHNKPDGQHCSGSMQPALQENILVFRAASPEEGRAE